MSTQGSPDIGKIVSLIMENPDLIERISSLANQPPTSDHIEENEEKEEKNDSGTKKIEPTVAKAEPVYSESTVKSNRSQLLCALKPYVSKERAQAIDSMISIAEILDMMKGR